MSISKEGFTKNLTAKIIGKGILLGSIQVAIGSVEMSSKFSVLSFAKDQDTLQRAADALTSYIVIGLFWAIGSSLVLYGSYGRLGVVSGIASNLFIMLWIIGSYLHAFKKAADRYNLEYPKMFLTI
jgi:hypothetical protein